MYLARATLYSVRLERYLPTYLPTLPYPACSRTSAPVTHCRSSLRTALQFLPLPSSFIATPFLVCFASVSTVGPSLYPSADPLWSQGASLLCISTRRICYGTDRRRDALCRNVLALIPTDVYRGIRERRSRALLLLESSEWKVWEVVGACLRNWSLNERRPQSAPFFGHCAWRAQKLFRYARSNTVLIH